MMPCVRPAPLSACTLLGTRMAYPQPLARTCCCHVGPGGGPPGVGPGPRPGTGPGPRPPGPLRPKPNSIITGTGPLALAGVVKVNCMSTVMSGYDELSTWPTSCFTITGTSPFISLVVLVTSQLTLGVALGTRP